MSYQVKTFEELSIEERRASTSKSGRPNLERIKECLLGINETADFMRIESFQTELSSRHAAVMHDYIIELENQIDDYLGCKS